MVRVKVLPWCLGPSWSHGSVGLNDWTALNTPQIHKLLPPGKLHGCGSQHIALHSSAPNSGNRQAGIQQDSGGSGPSPTSPVQTGGFSIGKPPIARSRCSRRSTTESCASVISVIHLYICDSSIHTRLAWRTQTHCTVNLSSPFMMLNDVKQSSGPHSGPNVSHHARPWRPFANDHQANQSNCTIDPTPCRCQYVLQIAPVIVLVGSKEWVVKTWMPEWPKASIGFYLKLTT